MSTAKVISVYFLDLYDFLDELYLQNEKKFHLIFQNMEDDTKINLVTKVAVLYQKLDTLKTSETLYWNSNIANTTGYLIIISLTLIAVTFVSIYMYFKTAKTRVDVDLIKTTLFHLLIYMVLLGIALIILINTGDAKSYNTACKNISIDMLNDLIYNRILTTHDTKTNGISNLMLYLGYKIKNNGLMYKKYYRIMKTFNPPQFGEIFNFQGDADSDMHKDIDYLTLYNLLANDLLISLKTLYNDGKGYDDINEFIMISNNNYLLNESRKIMNYYFYITYKSYHPSIAFSKQNSETNDQIIDNIIISNLKLLKQNLYDPIDTSYTNTLYDNTKLEFQQIMFAYQLLFADTWQLYNVYHKIAINNDVADLIADLGYSVSIDNWNFDCDMNDSLCKQKVSDFKAKIKEFFTNTHNTYYESCLNRMAAAPDITSANDVIIFYHSKYNFFFTGLYNDLFIQIWNIDLFPCKFHFVNSQLNNDFYGKYSSIPNDYINDFCDLVAKNLVMNIFNNFTKSLEPTMVDKVAVQLSKYPEIKIDDYTQYTLDQMGIQGNSSQMRSQREYYLDLLTRIKIAITNKSINNNNFIDFKFLETPDFIIVLDNLNWNDFKNSLDIDHYSRLIDKFYQKTNDVINNKAATISPDNIFYPYEKKLKLYRVILIFGVLILILGYIYFITDIVIDYPRKGDFFRDRSLNYSIKVVGPTFATLFIVVLLISHYTKSVASFQYNKDVIDTNSKILRDNLVQLRKDISYLDNRISDQDKFSNIGNIQTINNDIKTDLFNTLKNIIARYNKCNYLVINASGNLEFPYTEIVVYLMMTIISLVILIYTINQFQPITRIISIRELYKMKHDAEFSDDMVALTQDVNAIKTEHDEHLETLVFTLKVTFFVLAVLFLIYYMSQVINSSVNFEQGLYNSKYYDESRTYNFS